MVNLDGGSCQFAPVLEAPCQRGNARVGRRGAPSRMRGVARAQANYRTESARPCKTGHLRSDVGIRLKLQSIRARSGLVLVDHEGASEAHAVIAQLPAGGIMIRGTRERSAAEHQQVPSLLNEREDVGPRFFRSEEARVG